jgi:hypothetical protein
MDRAVKEDHGRGLGGAGTQRTRANGMAWASCYGGPMATGKCFLVAGVSQRGDVGGFQGAVDDAGQVEQAPGPFGTKTGGTGNGRIGVHRM